MTSMLEDLVTDTTELRKGIFSADSTIIILIAY
jgi:hypothetical protein